MMASVGNGSFQIRFGRFSLAITSGHLLTIIVIVGLMVLLVGGGYSLVQQAQSEHVAIRAEHKELYQTLSEALDDMAYLVSLPEERRPELFMPPSLQRRMVMPR